MDLEYSFHRHCGMDLPGPVLICRRLGQGTLATPTTNLLGRDSSHHPHSISINGPFMIVTPAKRVTGRAWSFAGSYSTCSPVAIGLISDPILKILLGIHHPPPWPES